MTVERAQLRSALDVLLTVFALLVLPSLIADAVAEENADLLSLAADLDWVLWFGFAFTLVAIFILSDNRRRAVRTYALDIALVLITPPVMPAALQALRALRILRLARLVLVGLRLHRYARKLRRASVIGPATVALGLLLLGAAAALRMVDPDQVPSFGHALWWTVARSTALGDAGLTLESPASRAIELVVVVAGLAYLSLLTAAIASVFLRTEVADPEATKLDDIVARLARIEQDLQAANSHGLRERAEDLR